MIVILLALLAVVNVPNPSVSYACNGVTAVYTVSFPYLASGDLTVTSTTPAGIGTTLAQTTDWSVNLASTSSTATLTLNSPGTKCPSGNVLKIARSLALTQPYSFKAQTTYNQTLHEQAYDREVMLIQQTDAKVSSTDVKAYVDAAVSATLTGGSVVQPITWNLAGDGAANVFSIPNAVVNSPDLYIVTIDGVFQRPTTDYTVSTSAAQITFASVPALNAVISVRSFGYARALSVGDNTSVLATGGTVPRMLKDRFGDLKTVKDYGAVGDGVTDDTVAIQAALNASHDVFIPAGTYKINGDSAFTGGGKDCVDGGIAPRSDSRIVLAPDATLKAKANSTGNYCVLRIKGVSNVTVTGGTIDGNRAAGTGPGGSQYGYAIGIVGSTNIVIDSMLLKNAWGDGIVTDNTRVPDPVVTTANVLINNVVSDNNRRQGLSILNGTDILVQNSVFSNSNGVAPQDGIDIEPGGDTNFAKRITIIGCNAKNNAGHGINVQGTSTGVNVEDINLTGNTVTSNSLNGINLYTASGGVNLTGNTARSNTQDGFHLEIASNVNLTGNHATSNTGDGFSLSNGVSNVTLTGNDTLGNTRGVVVFDAGGTRPTGIVISANAIKQSNQHGIYFLNTDDSLIVGNLVTSASQSANNTYHGINVQTSNRIGIVGNSMRQGALANRPGYGLILNQGADLTVASNDFINSGLAGVDVLQTTPVRFLFYANKWTAASLDQAGLAGAVVALTAQTANLGATSVYAAAPVGEYRVCATARTTTSGTGTVATLNIIWTDEGGVKTDAVGTWALNSVTVTGQINKCEYIHAAAASNIQVSVTAGTYGTSVYAISATAEKLN